jgi:hypothetical protein
MHSWPNIGFTDSVHRWEDEHGRIAHCTYQEICWDQYQRFQSRRRAMKNRREERQWQSNSTATS